MNLIPLGDRVVIEPFPKETKTAGGIIIPDTAKASTPLKKGTVVSKADDVDLLNVGDVILYAANAGTEITEDGKAYLMMGYDAIWGKVPKQSL